MNISKEITNIPGSEPHLHDVDGAFNGVLGHTESSGKVPKYRPKVQSNSVKTKLISIEQSPF